MIKEVLNFHFTFSIIFCLYYMIVNLINEKLFRMISYVYKYKLIKSVPVVTIFSMLINYFIRNEIILYNPTINLHEKLVGSVQFDKIQKILFQCNFNSMFMKMCFYIWIDVACILFFRYLALYIRFRILLNNVKLMEISKQDNLLEELEIKEKLKCKICIYYSSSFNIPFTYGVRKPRIIIPEKLKKEHSEIIKHEIVHCIQKDVLVKRLLEIIKIVFWYHPLVYGYCSKTEEYCEFACDAKVVEKMVFEKRKHYASAIIDVLKFPYQKSVFTVNMQGKGDLKMRLKNILYMGKVNQKDNKKFKIAGISGVMVIFLCSIFLCYSFPMNKEQLETEKIDKLIVTIQYPVKGTLIFGQNRENKISVSSSF